VRRTCHTKAPGSPPPAPVRRMDSQPGSPRTRNHPPAASDDERNDTAPANRGDCRSAFQISERDNKVQCGCAAVVPGA
jgi:hypothetical protein